MPSLPQTPERYLRAPRLRSTPGGAELRAVAWDCEEGVERTLRWQLDEDGALEGPEEGTAHAAIPVLDEDGQPAGAAAELRAREGDAEVWVRVEGGVAEVRLRRGEDDVLVWRAKGTAAAPALARAEGGHWIAWHHDVREDDARPDVAKWIALRFVSDAGEVRAPSAPMKERDRDREGVEQSFEFPALVVGDDGAVALFGRGSHNFWRQDLSAAGWGPRVGLSDGEWGSRGRRCAAARLGSRLVTARRERRVIEVVVQDAPAGGAPALAPATIDLTARQRFELPALDRTRDPARRHGLSTYFGDIQQHSAHSDGVGGADEAYWRARWRYGDDFVALTDHESFLGKRTGPGEWEYLQQVADRHEAPGAFATLLAYEWTGKMYPGPGHKCVYLPERGLPLVSRDELPEGRALVQRIKELGGIAAPHHIGWTGCDEEGHDPEGQPFWEIVSCHGCYEHADHPLGMRGEHTHQLADVMLKKGHRFGFTGSTDSHGLLWHHGEARKRDPYRTGLCAVQAPELSRDAVFSALRARRCYATSGVKILLDVRVNGAPMGSEIEASGPLEVEVEAVAEGPIARVDLVTEAGTITSAPGEGDAVRFEGELEGRYVYARVVQEDGEMAWSSPVFVD
ncbi:MAG TPA: CehA/McbA family metallohydrolase [Polyangiaceae bacterium LLY-WYZ-15_(1-7)]|nr:CehA/McbA family metallohydrolase [Polyangiaceae bacterium LLY-WYZ-15_(1-7)]